MISEARKYGIRLILSFVNNYNDFGGKAQYAQWARSAGAHINGDDDFYTHPLLKDYYKNHIRVRTHEFFCRHAKRCKASCNLIPVNTHI